MAKIPVESGVMLERT